MKNTIKTVLLLTAISALFLAIGHMLGGRAGMMTALIMSLVMNFGAYWFSDKIVLSMHRAVPVGPGHASGVYEHVADLCARSSLPVPKVYIIPEGAPNAFATGRDPHHSAVAVTEGLLEILNERELRGVLAHELSHIQNRDVLISTIVATMASAILYLAHMMQWFGIFGGHSRDQEGRGGLHPLAMLFTILVAPLAATLVQAAVSRTREFMADETGALISQDPEALASALQKISSPEVARFARAHSRVSQDMQPAFSHMYIVNHFSGGSVMNLFSTHPPTRERIKKLLSMRG